MPLPIAGVPLLIDCDTGIDDSLALLFACASPDADIRAITCVAGNVDARQVAINTLAILELAGRTDIHVALGRQVPIMRGLVTTPRRMARMGWVTRRSRRQRCCSPSDTPLTSSSTSRARARAS